MPQNYSPALQKMIPEKVEQDVTFHPLNSITTGVKLFVKSRFITLLGSYCSGGSGAAEPAFVAREKTFAQ